MSKNCVVIFPLYKAPSAIELEFLENGLSKTKGFKQVIVAPEGLIVDSMFGNLEKLEVKRFSRHFFDGIKGYNQLLLSRNFYSAFSLYDYILIHQSDVFLFKEELALWCEKDYDYIGAPWFRPEKLNRGLLFNALQRIKIAVKRNKIYGNRHNKAGNGGLSLRKVNTALSVLDKAPSSLLKKYNDSKEFQFNEDIFWSFEAPLILSTYKVPDLKEAMQFAIEFEPRKAYQFLNGNLPFGCHAPQKHDVEFWKKFIPNL